MDVNLKKIYYIFITLFIIFHSTICFCSTGIPETIPPSSTADDNGIYVSTAGSDSTGNGTINAPFRTITHALSIAQSGQSIILRGSPTLPSPQNIYNESVRVRNPNISIRSKSDEWAVIQCPINDENNFAICVQFDPDAKGGKLQRVEVIGGYYYGISFETKWDWGDPSDRTGASNMLIEDCKIHDTGHDSIKIKPNCDDITIRRCEIYNSGAFYPPGTPADDKNSEGIDNVNGDRMLVQDSYIHDTATTGVYFKGGATDCIVERTTIKNAGSAGIMVGFDTSPEFFDLTVNPEYYESIRGIVRNNIISNTGYAGIGLYAAKDAKIYNNTISNAASNTHSAIYFGITFQDWESYAKRPANINPVIMNNLINQSNNACVSIRYTNDLGGLSALSGNPTMDYNLYYSSAGQCVFDDNRPTSTLDDGNLSNWKTHIAGESHSFETNPLLEADFHLKSNSPAIDAGTTSAYVSYDIDKQSRINSPDIGADEKSSDAPPPASHTVIICDLNGDNNQDIIKKDSDGRMQYTTNLSEWTQVSGALQRYIACGDLNSDGNDDIAGINSSGTLLYTLDRGSKWNEISGSLSKIFISDINGDNNMDILGLNDNGNIYVTYNLSSWTNIPGALVDIVPGNFDISKAGQEIAGLNSNGYIYYTVNQNNWTNIPGTLSKLFAGDINSDGKFDLMGLNSNNEIFYTTNLTTWTNLPGSLVYITVGDLNGDGKKDIVGLNITNNIWHTTNLKDWTNIPGQLTSLSTGDVDGDGKDDVIGIGIDGNLWHTTNLTTWQAL